MSNIHASSYVGLLFLVLYKVHGQNTTLVIYVQVKRSGRDMQHSVSN